MGFNLKMDPNYRLEERIEAGSSPLNLILEIRKPYGESNLGVRYKVVKSPFLDESGSGEISARNFRSSSATWEMAIRDHPDSIGVAKAYARDADDITHIDRIWGNIGWQVLDASGYGRSVKRYFEKAGIDVQVLHQDSSLGVIPGEDSSHPLNRIAKQLDNIGVGVQVNTSNNNGSFHPLYNVVVMSIKSMLQEDYEHMVGTLYHEAIHAIMANLPDYCETLNPFRARQNNRQTGLEDPYKKHLSFDEIIAHAAGGLFGSLTPANGKSEQDPNSVKLMDTIIKDCTFTQFIFSQYDFSRTSFDNSNWGSCSAHIDLKREYYLKTKKQEAKAVLRLGAVTTYALPTTLREEVDAKLGEDGSVSLIDLHKKDRTLAMRVLEEVRIQTQVHHDSATSAREFLVKVQEKPEINSEDDLRRLIDERIGYLRQVPGIQEIETHTLKILNLCRDYYVQLLNEQ